MLKLVAIDTETTGLDARKNGLLTMAGKVLIQNQIIDSFEFKMRPFDEDEIDDAALKVNHISVEELNSFPTAQEVLPEVKNYFYKFIDHDNPTDLLTMVGFNVGFDRDFVRNWFIKLGALNSYKNIFHYKTIDVQALVLTYLFANGMDVNMNKFHQVDCARAIGINVDDKNLHDASYDSSISLEIFFKMKEVMTKIN